MLQVLQQASALRGIVTLFNAVGNVAGNTVGNVPGGNVVGNNFFPFFGGTFPPPLLGPFPAPLNVFGPIAGKLKDVYDSTHRPSDLEYSWSRFAYVMPNSTL